MAYYLTVDVGGTDMKYGVITSDEKLVFKSVAPTNGHLGGQNVIKQIKDFFNEQSKNYKLEGVAICSTGAINEDTQMLSPSISINNYESVNFRRDLKELNVPVSVENDVNSMALAEIDFVENAENFKSIFTMTIGTGIGGAMFINNKLHRGHSFSAGECGKMCILGNQTFEELASTWALVKKVQAVYPNVKNGIEVFELYDKKDEKVVPIVEENFDYLALGIANLIYILNPEQIVIGGGVTNRGEKFLDEINVHLKPKLWNLLTDKYQLSIAKYKNDAGMIGAFKLFKELFLN